MQNQIAMWRIAVALTLTVGMMCPTLAATVELELMTNAWNIAVVDAIQDGTQRFEQQNPNVKITVRPRVSWDDFVVRSIAGTPPDLVTVGTFQSGEYTEKNMILPLDKYVTPQLRSELWEPMWRNFIWQGRINAVPAVEAGPRLGLVWNADMVDDSGIAVDPHQALTWQTFFELSDKLTKVDSTGQMITAGYDPRNGQNSRIYTIAPLWSADVFHPQTGFPVLNSPVLVNMVEYFTDKTFAKYQGWKGTSDWYAIAKKLSATSLLGVYAPGEIRTRDPQMRIKVTWPPHVQAKKTQQALGWGLAIPTGAKNPDESWKLLQFLATDVTFQLDLFHRTGFMGASRRFMSRLANETRDENVRWYIDSLWNAEILDAPLPDRFYGTADSLFLAAANKAYTRKEAAASAIGEANRLLTTQMLEQGRLK